MKNYSNTTPQKEKDNFLDAKFKITGSPVGKNLTSNSGVPGATPGLSRELLLLLLSRFSRVRLCATPQTAAHQAPLSLGFSRQEYWSGLPFPSPMRESQR